MCFSYNTKLILILQNGSVSRLVGLIWVDTSSEKPLKLPFTMSPVVILVALDNSLGQLQPWLPSILKFQTLSMCTLKSETLDQKPPWRVVFILKNLPFSFNSSLSLLWTGIQTVTLTLTFISTEKKSAHR